MLGQANIRSHSTIWHGRQYAGWNCWCWCCLFWCEGQHKCARIAYCSSHSECVTWKTRFCEGPGLDDRTLRYGTHAMRRCRRRHFVSVAGLKIPQKLEHVDSSTIAFHDMARTPCADVGDEIFCPSLVSEFLRNLSTILVLPEHEPTYEGCVEL